MSAAPKRTVKQRPPRIAFSTRAVAPPELDDAEYVTRLVRDAETRPCAACAATGRAEVDGRVRVCAACDGTRDGGTLARRVLTRWPVECCRTLARVIHYQRPELPLPGLDAARAA